jgi:hypothetical protein
MVQIVFENAIIAGAIEVSDIAMAVKLIILPKTRRDCAIASFMDTEAMSLIVSPITKIIGAISKNYKPVSFSLVLPIDLTRV